jgi:hypothetical protein
MAPCLPAKDQAELLSDRQHRDRHDPEPAYLVALLRSLIMRMRNSTL